MSSGDKNQQVGPGLGQPLVTIPTPGSIYRGVAVPAGDNHPLATTPALEPPGFIAGQHPLATPALEPPGLIIANQATNASVSGPSVSTSISSQAPPPIVQTPPSVVQIRTPARPVAASPAQLRVISAAVSPSKSLDALADEFLSERSYRTDRLGLAPVLRPSPLPPEDGIHRLRTLVDRRAWGDVLKISTSILNSPKDPHADVYASLVTLPLNAPQVDASNVPLEIRQETVEIMALQCHAWLKLRRYVDLATEVERWNFSKHNDATAQSPDWLPWSIRTYYLLVWRNLPFSIFCSHAFCCCFPFLCFIDILAAQTLQYTDELDRASDIMFELRERIPESEPLSLVNVDNALANLFLKQGQWRLALGSLDRILKLTPAATEAEVQSKFASASNPSELQSILTLAYKCEILSRQGRALLQAGALPQVAEVFEFAKTTWDEKVFRLPPELENHPVVKLIPVQMEANAALFDFAKSHFDRALESFQKAVDLLRKLGDLSPKYNRENWIGPAVAGFDAPNELYSECVNNMALCCLYTCRMKDAIGYLEGLIREDPTSFLNERVAFNLCTLYELGSDSAASARRKRVLQLIAKRFFLHDVGPESFRVT